MDYSNEADSFSPVRRLPTDYQQIFTLCKASLRKTYLTPLTFGVSLSVPFGTVVSFGSFSELRWGFLAI
jgi:hypothetical protein